MNISLKGKVILVTGGSRGIGAAICRALGQAGATIAVHYRRNQKQAESIAKELGQKSKAFRADLAHSEEAINLFNQVNTYFRKIDILINNAGVAFSIDMKESDKRWIDTWDETFAINTRAQGILCKKAVEVFKSNGGGKMINIASRAAFRGDTLDYLAYGASKGAIPALTRSIARYCGKDNIQAFCIAPGFEGKTVGLYYINLTRKEVVLSIKK